MKSSIIHPWEGYVKPFCISGNLYFVGTRPASTHIIDTGDGLILIDPGYPQSLYLVTENIRSLGFSVKDIKYIVITHGHYDHLGAARALIEMTGAKTFIGKEDALYANGEEDLTWARELGTEYYEAFEPDVLLSDGDIIELGDTRILCKSATGHTPGTMAFFFDVTDGTSTLRAGMHGGVGMNSMKRDFLDRYNLTYHTREQFVPCIKRLMEEKVDIFLGNHVGNNDTVGKSLRITKDYNPFINSYEWKEFLQYEIQTYNDMIKKEGEEDMRESVIKKVEEEKIVAIVRGVDKKDIVNFAKAVYEGGIRLLEVTYNAADPSTDSETAEKIKMLVDQFGDKMLIGAGTVLNEKQVELTKNAGGKFIISPDTNEKVIKKTLELGLVSMPGAFTPTEAQAAHTYGADFVKLFPTNALGLPYLKAIMAPLSHIKFLAVGGVDENNIKEFMSSGVAGFGIGSGIVNKKHIKEGNWAEITALAKKYTDALK